MAPGPFSGLTPTYAAEMLVAFFAEIVYINHLDSLEGCAVDGKDTVESVYAALKAVFMGDFDSAFGDVVSAAVSLASAVQDCEAAPEDVKAIGYWLMRRAGSKQLAVDSCSANSDKHSQEMFNAVEDVWAVFFTW